MRRPVNVRSRTRTDDWEHALASGNGRQGLLSYGGGAEPLRFTFSHERLFLPLHPPLDPPNTAHVLPRLRDLLAAGRHQEAAAIAQRHAVAENAGYAETRDSDRFVGAGTLRIELARPAGQVTGYHRHVDLSSGVVRQSWQDGDTRVTADAFVSRVDDVAVLRVRAHGPRRLAGTVRLGPIDGQPPHPVRFTVGTGYDALTLRAAFDYARDWPRALPGYVLACRIVATAPAATQGRAGPTNGTVTPAGDGLRFHGDLLILARTVVGRLDADNADNADDADDVGDVVVGDVDVGDVDVGGVDVGDVDVGDIGAQLAALPADWDRLADPHARAHADLFHRVHLDLGGGRDPRPDTEDLLAGPAGAALVETLFDAGRHLVISATGELPPNLQGVWSGTWQPAWSGDYTLDGNLQAAVAAMLTGGTPELLLTVFDLLDRFRVDFATNAKRLYGAAGLLVPAHCASHGLHNHFNARWCLTFWTAGGGWLARLYHDYWQHTGDRSFLATRALPFMAAVADFYLDFVQFVDGRAVFSPSYSPENAPSTTGSQACVDATMDAAVVADLLRNLLTAVRELGLRDPREPRWRTLLARLPPYRIAPDGELAEWLPPELADNHAHRHASHLFSLWHEPDPALLADPALREAAATAVRRRLAWWRGEEADEMAFGLVQLGLAAARLGLAEEAHEAVRALTRYWRPSLVSTHNRGALFNIDICGGLPALVLAMLVTSAHGRVHLLPALAPAWPRGEVTGVHLRGPVRLESMCWAPGRLTATLVPGYSGPLRLVLPAGATLTDLAGDAAHPAGGAGAAHPAGGARTAHPEDRAGAAHPKDRAGAAHPKDRAGEIALTVRSGRAFTVTATR